MKKVKEDKETEQKKKMNEKDYFLFQEREVYIKVKEKSENGLKGEIRRRLKEVKVTQRQIHPYDRVAVQMNANAILNTHSSQIKNN